MHDALTAKAVAFGTLPAASISYSLLALVLILVGSTAVVVRRHAWLRGDDSAGD